MQTNNDEFNKAEFNRAKKIVNEYKTKRKEALKIFSQYKKIFKKDETKRKEALKIFNQYKETIKKEELDARKFLKTVPNNIKFQNINKEMIIRECNLSCRLFSCIFYKLDFDIESKISDLSNISVNEFLKCRGVAKVTLQELKDLCFHAGISIQD